MGVSKAGPHRRLLDCGPTCRCSWPLAWGTERRPRCPTLATRVQHLRERDDAVLRHAIGTEADVGHEPGKRRGEEQVPPIVLSEQARQEGFDAMDRAPQVDVDDPTPLIVG